LVREADVLRGKNASELVQHRKKVETWILNLRAVYEAYKTKGSPEWDSVKRMKFLLWWIDEPAGKKGLLRS
jgi:hypothetical protein